MQPLLLAEHGFDVHRLDKSLPAQEVKDKNNLAQMTSIYKIKKEYAVVLKNPQALVDTER